MPHPIQASSRRTARHTASLRWVQMGVIICGLAGGLVELVALQRRRIKDSHRGTMAPWWY